MFDMTSDKYKGLTASQAKEKLRKEGYNNLPSSQPKNFFSIALGVVKEPMFILLVACGTLYMVMGDIREGLMLLGFVFVIMDDNFLSIVGAIKMGRRIFDNLQKAFGYTLAIHVPIAGLSLIPILLGNFPLILWPVHIVFLELIIDPACSIIFEAEKEEANIMNRPPKRIDEPFLGVEKILLSCLQGVGILIITFIVYTVGLHLGYDAKEVRAMAFIALIVSNIAIILTNRSWTDNIFKIIVTPNKAVLWVVGGAMLFLSLIFNIPFFLHLFQFNRLTLINIVTCSSAGLTTIVWFEIYKMFKLSKHVAL